MLLSEAAPVQAIPNVQSGPRPGRKTKRFRQRASGLRKLARPGVVPERALLVPPDALSRMPVQTVRAATNALVATGPAVNNHAVQIREPGATVREAVAKVFVAPHVPAQTGVFVQMAAALRVFVLAQTGTGEIVIHDRSFPRTAAGISGLQMGGIVVQAAAREPENAFSIALPTDVSLLQGEHHVRPGIAIL